MADENHQNGGGTKPVKFQNARMRNDTRRFPLTHIDSNINFGRGERRCTGHSKASPGHHQTSRGHKSRLWRAFAFQHRV
jgi:hypothetical protein